MAPRKAPTDNARATRPGRGRTRSGPPRVVIVASRYNASITTRLVDAALDEFRHRTGSAQLPRVVNAPGSFELPAICMAVAQHGSIDGIVAIGCIIRGETCHDRVIADAVARGLVDVALRTGVPVSFGVLTVDSVDQAVARAGSGESNRGRRAMSAVLDAIDVIRAERAGVPARRVGQRRPAAPDKARGGA